jgi:hypothetical protein
MDHIIRKRGIATGLEFCVGPEFILDQLDKLGVNATLTCHGIDPIIELSLDKIFGLYRGLVRTVLDFHGL